MCISLALAGPAPAADLKPLRLVVNGSAPEQALATARQSTQASPTADTGPVADPVGGPVAGLLHDLQHLLDWVFAGHAAEASPAYGPPAAFAAVAPGPAAEIVPYSGPLAAGTVILNIDRLRVYRVLGGGRAELYQETSEAAVLARVGMAR